MIADTGPHEQRRSLLGHAAIESVTHHRDLLLAPGVTLGRRAEDACRLAVVGAVGGQFGGFLLCGQVSGQGTDRTIAVQPLGAILPGDLPDVQHLVPAVPDHLAALIVVIRGGLAISRGHNGHPLRAQSDQCGGLCAGHPYQ